MNTVSFDSRYTAETNVPSTLDFNKGFTEQVKTMLEKAGTVVQTADEICLSGQAVAAILMLPAPETIKNLPTITCYGFGQQVQRVGSLGLSDWRNNVVRPHRKEIPEGEAFTGYTVIDGGVLGLEPFQLKQLAMLLKTMPENIRLVNVNVGQINPANPGLGMTEALVETGLTKADWASGRVLYKPAGFGLAAAVQATCIYGLAEVWPRVIRTTKKEDQRFHIEEVVIPQDMRDFGSSLAAKWINDQTEAALAELEEKLRQRGFETARKGTSLVVDGIELQVSSAKRL